MFVADEIQLVAVPNEQQFVRSACWWHIAFNFFPDLNDW